MILLDINILLHAYNNDSPHHSVARAWLADALNGDRSIGLPWAVLLGFLRIATNGRILANPLPVSVACAHMRTWLEQPQVTIPQPGTRHASILFELLESIGTAGNLTTDAHLATLAIEHQAELYSTDSDFGRFPGLRWINPFTDRET